MNGNGEYERRHGLLRHLTQLPKRIVDLHHQSNVSEFVLHNLCCSDGFNISRAAFLVENPDFDCVKGIAGYCRTEDAYDHQAIWKAPEEYSRHMSESVYNNKVRLLLRQYNESFDEKHPLFASIIEELDIKDPALCRWKMKHNNSGVLLYERSRGAEEEIESYLAHGANLLSFCPIF